jgi:hypothetical protein
MTTVHNLTRGPVPSLFLSRWRHGAKPSLFHTTSSLLLKRVPPSGKRLPLSPPESEKMQALLRKGCQVWEIAQSIGRSEPAVKLALKGNDGLAGLLQGVKKGRWTPAEREFIRAYLAEWSVPDKKRLAKEMGRTVESVGGQLRKLARQRELDALLSSPAATPVVKLTKSEVAHLRSLLDRILESLDKTRKTEK